MESNVKNIVFVHTAFLGDLLLSIGFLKNLKKKYPSAQIHLVCREGVGSLLQKLQLVDHCYEIQKGNSESYKTALVKLKSLSFDFLFSAHSSFRTAWFVRSIKADKKIAFRNFWNFIFYNQRVDKNKFWPEPLRVLQLLAAVDIETKQRLNQIQTTDFSKKNSSGLLPLPPEWSQISIPMSSQISAEEDVDVPFYAIFPGSVWNTKKWREEHFVQLAKNLSQNAKVLLFGGKDEKELCEVIAAQVESSAYPVEVVAGKLNLFEVVQKLAKAQVVISNDSAGAHLAAVANVPTVAIFGPTVTSFGYRPWSPLSTVVENENLSCRPCGKHGHKVCPIGTHECMKSIAASEVLKAINLLKTLSH